VVFRRQRVAVFIDGCYWHGCPEHGTTPLTNTGYWSAKVAANQARDRDTEMRLAEAGWLSARYWEHDDPAAVAADVRRLVNDRRAADA
jgi:DNA mismatch endonuclease (patch repair protein)